MLMYLSAIGSGQVDPLWPHVLLLSLSVLASFTVAAGIILESPKYSASVRGVATLLVIGGVAIEALCTVFLFVFDEGISNAQQSKIIALETRLAPRKIEDTAAIVEKLRHFSGTPFDVSIQPDSEPLGLMDQLTGILKEAGWNWVPAASNTGLQFNAPGKPPMGWIILRGGVEIRASPNRWSNWKDAVNVLGEELKAEKLSVLAAQDAQANDNAIHIRIGTKE